MFYGALILPIFVITTAYKGSLISILTIDVPKKPVDTMKQLAKYNYTVGSRGTHSCGELKQIKNQYANQLGEHCSRYESFEAGFDIIRDNPYFAMTEGRVFSDYKRRGLYSKR